ncbi:DUF6090 family protein [Paraglaciecola sp.]|uniref:DUF6090 family protein n=1 Tax=Paraglaciecola sp. TaxID=1920173 RepID=UPI003EF2A78F
MLLRSITKHIRSQNWFAVALDLLIVVVGVFFGIQVANWNEAHKSHDVEQLVLQQLAQEFDHIETHLTRQISVRDEWVKRLRNLISAIEGDGNFASDDIKLGLSAAINPGRQAPQSAAYLQMVSGGSLASLSSAKLRIALIEYDARLQRDAFVHNRLVELIFAEMSRNEGIDRNLLINSRAGAQIDTNELNDRTKSIAYIRSFDLEALRAYEAHYETIFLLHLLQLTAEENQLTLTRDVSELIKISAKVQM